MREDMWYAPCFSNISVRVVSIGIGPLLLYGRVGETQLEWRLLPFAGYVEPYPILADRKLSNAFFIVGGVLGNALLIYIISSLGFAAAVDSPTVRDSLGAIVAAQIYFIMCNLYPINDWSIRNDGWRLLELLYRPSVTRHNFLEAYK